MHEMKELSLKRFRIMGFFVQAAVDIINTRGITNITIRQVAEKAGYNSATIYEYFENLDHLTYIAALQCIAPDLKKISDETIDIKDPYDRYFQIWEAFCRSAFEKPELHDALTFVKIDEKKLKKSMAEYHQFYQKEAPENDPVELLLREHDVFRWNKQLLLDIVSEGLFQKEDVDEISNLCFIIYWGVLGEVLSDREKKEIDVYVKKTMGYLSRCCSTYLK